MDHRFAAGFVFLWTSACAIDAHAEPDASADTESVQEAEELDLFDADTEVTRENWPRFNIRAGAMWLEGDGRLAARLNSTGTTIPILDFDDLGVDRDDTSYWLSLTWRSRYSRWGGWFGYWAFRGSGGQLFETELPIGPGESIPVGASVDVDFNTDWYIAEVTYSFVRSEKVDLGVGVGFHVVDLNTSLVGTVTVGEESGTAVNESLDTLAPLPNVLGYLHWKFAPRWNLTTRLGWFGLSYDKYSGEMTNFHGYVTYKISDRWTVSGGYQFVNLDLDIEEEFITQVYDIDFDGPKLLLGFTF